jgi:dihydrofolate reductase
MRSLKVFESVSVDGYFADRSGDIGFAHDVAPDPEFGGWVAQNASSGRDLLFGRKTFQMMEAFWTSAMAAAQMPEVARSMNAATKYVASRTLEPTWANSRLLEGELIGAVRALKQTAGPPLVLLGSGSLALALGEAGLVDEYQFVVVPRALGSGRTLFSSNTKLRLADQRVFKNGNVVLTYAT